MLMSKGNVKTMSSTQRIYSLIVEKSVKILQIGSKLLITITLEATTTKEIDKKYVVTVTSTEHKMNSSTRHFKIVSVIHKNYHLSPLFQNIAESNHRRRLQRKSIKENLD